MASEELKFDLDKELKDTIARLAQFEELHPQEPR